MKYTLLLFLIALLLGIQSFAQNVAINNDGSQPDPSAALDVKATDKGVLIPRVDFSNLPASPATGLLVYVTANGPDGNNAFYYYDGSQWQKLSGAVGLENFTESNFTYDSKTGVKITPNNGATDVGVVIQPKGTGAILAQQPDGTTAGGNNRGIYAVDLQMYRSDATQVASGDYSIIIGGKNNKATASNSLALGFDNTASSSSSIAIGGLNTANGTLGSVAIGYKNTANGQLSTALGVQTIASGPYATTLGYQTTASSVWTTAMGYGSNASGPYSIAMGRSSISSGDYAVAIGNTPTASGYAALAMGDYTTASGRISTAFGNRTIAPSAYETVIGRYNSDYTPSSTTDWIATDRLFVVGNGASDVTKSNALTILKNANTTIGGSLTINGNGTNTSITFPTGRGTNGQVLTTDGAGNTTWSDASSGGLTNFTESNFTYDSKYGVKFTPNSAQTDVDFVISPKGTGAILAQQPDGTTAGGNKRGIYAVDLQMYRLDATQVASGDYSIIFGGRNNTASGINSNAIGYSTTASGTASTAIGNTTFASGHSSTAMGQSTIASGFTSTAMGIYTTASGENSTAMGYNTVASGSYCIATGYYTVASGYYSIATGYYTNASGHFSTAMGTRTIAPSGFETVLGRYNTDYSPIDAYNWNSNDRLFVIGNGTADDTKSNALTILKNANTTIGGSLTINGNGTNTSVTFPTSRGTNGQVLQTDGSGNTSWETPSVSQWTTNGSTIYYNSGNIGIGTTTPNSKLTFSNSIGNGFDDWSDYKMLLYTDATPQQSYGIGIKGNTLAFNSDRDYDFDQDGSTVMTIQEGKVGIGTESPYALLDLGSSISNRKIILYSSADNDHQFTGFGLNADALRFQLANTSGNFKFYGATSTTASTELFRIQGNGQIMIPALTTAGVLLNSSTGLVSSSVGTSGQVLTTNGSGAITWATPASGTVTGVSGSAPIVSSGGNAPVISINAATTSTAGSMSATDKTKLDGLVGSQWTTSGSNIYYNSGNIGIGTTTPNSKLTFSNSIGNGFDEWSDYKMLLYTDATPQQSYGIGIKGNTLAFNSDRDYDFDQDGSTVMTIQEGKVGIGTESPRAMLDLGNSISNRKIMLYSSADNDHQFTGLGLNADALRFQLATTTGNFKFYGATSSSASTELFRIQGNGQVVIPAMTTAGVVQNNASGVLSSTKGTANQVLKMNAAGTATEWGNAIEPGTAAGQMQYWNGTAWVTVAAGQNGQVLKFRNGVPTWENDNIINLSVGDSYQGGIIAYFLQPGDQGYDPDVLHGIIAAPEDQSSSIEWGCNGTPILIVRDKKSIGYGEINTNNICAFCSTTNIAARLCRDLSLNGYDDWFLPSADEMKQIALNKDHIPGIVSNGDYWTSTEYIDNEAYVTQIESPNVYYGGSKSWNLRVRAIRYF